MTSRTTHKKNLIASGILALLIIATSCYFLLFPSSDTMEEKADHAQNPDVATPELSSSQIRAQAQTPAKAPVARPTVRVATPSHESTCSCSGCSGAAKTVTITAKKPHPSARITLTQRQAIFSTSEGQPITFTLPGAGSAAGVVEMTRQENGRTIAVQGTLTKPQAGSFFFQLQSMPGVAGEMVGVVRFDEGDIAYSVEPGADGQPELREKHADNVFCRNYASPPERIEAPQHIPADHPTSPPIPAYQNGVVPLSSLPGATAVAYLDFDGAEGPYETWGDNYTAAPANTNNSNVRDVWERVAEDFAPYNINITTDLQVFLDAPQNSRIRCIITPTDTAAPGAGGVAFLGSFNWTGDTPCWVFQTWGKSCAEAVSHEIGHTLDLSHDGTSTQGYYGGHGSGDGWAPIMGVGYYENLSQWSKGEYSDANQTQDDLAIIDSNNNNVDYRADDHGGSLATASHLEILSDNSVASEGIIETTADEDGLKFTVTASSSVSLTVSPVATGPNLDVFAEILNSTGSVVTSHNPTNSLSATVSTNLSAGEYFLRVSGVGKGDPLVTGYTDYASLGFYKVTGTVPNAVKPDRFSIAENPAAAAAVGTPTPNNAHGSDTVSYAIASGNNSGAFAINTASGALTVADPNQFNYETLSSYYDDPATYDLSVSITNSTTPSLNETVRVVVTVADVNEAPVMTSVATTRTIFEGAPTGTDVWTATATDGDHYDGVTYSISAGNSLGHFAVNAITGQVTVAALTDADVTPSYSLTVTASDTGSPALTDSVILTVNLDLNESPVANDATFAILENSSADALVGTVIGSDADAGDTLSYAITAGNANEIFAIDSNSGAITLAGAFDYESTPSYTLTVTVTDAAGANDTSTITVNVTDVTEVALAHWKFDETSGTVAADSSGNAHNGTVNNGAAWVAGRKANGLDFDGVDDRVSFGTGPALSGKVPFTVSAWVKVPSGSSTLQMILSQRDGSAAGYNGEYLLKVNADGTVGFIVYKDGFQFDFSTTDLINDGTWHHVAAVRAGNKGRIYIDGVEKAAATGAARDLVSTLEVYAGADALDNGNFFTGVMDDLRIHAMALSTTEIAQLTSEPPVANDAIFGIAENSSADVLVGTVTASDPDAGDTLTYTITAGDSDGIFAIAANSGAITLIGALDYEGTPSYALTVTVSDAAGLSDTSTITINVTDVTEAALAHWKFDETSGSLAADSSGNAHNGTVNNGAAWVAGNSANGLDFDGVNDSVSFGTGPALNGKVPFTVSAWVKVPSGSNTVQLILNQRDVTESGYNGEYMFRVNSNGSVGFMVYKDGYQFDFDTTDLINDGTWHHVAAVRAGNKGRIYIDGVEKATATGAARDLVSTIEVYAGADRRDNISFFTGVMDEVRIHAMALSATEITGLMNDVNGAPVASNATFGVAEDATTGSSVGTVIATDLDLGDTLTYAITGGNGGGEFTINSATGEITTAAALDYETTPSYALTVTVTDDGTPALNDTATITVNVTNVTSADDSDADSLNDDWEATHFGNLTTTATSDDDEDGYTAFEEMVFGMDPTVNDSGSAPMQGRIVDDGGVDKFEFKFRRPQNWATLNVTYQLQTGSDLVELNWADDATTPTTSMDGSNEWITFLLPLPSGAETRNFYRCKVTPN